MNTRSERRQGREFAAPTRNSRFSVVGAIGQLQLPQAFVCLIFFLAAIQIGGPAIIVAQIGLMGAILFYQVVYQPKAFLGIFKFWPLLLLPLLAIASMAWSVAPNVSSRFGIQLLLTAIIGIVIARAVTAREYVALLYVASALFTVFCVASGRTGSGAKGLVLIGLTGSKNEMGYALQLLLTVSIAVLIDRGQPTALRLSSFVAMATAIVLLLIGQATGALLAACGSVAILGALALLHLFKIGGRLVIIVAILTVAVPVAAERDLIVKKVEEFTHDVLKKDTKTMTGRTWLWARADELIRDRPVLGHGYRAIMVGDTLEGRGILAWANQSDGRAFHFHNTYKDIGVDLGYTGVVLFILTVGLGLIFLIRTTIAHPTPAYSFILATYLVMLARSPVELVLGTFALSASMLFSMLTWAFAKPPEDAQWKARTPRTSMARRTLQRMSPEALHIADPVRHRR